MSLLSASEGGREEQRRKLAEGGKMPERAQRIRSGQGDRYSSAVCLLAQISGSKLAAKPEGITAQTHLQHYTARGLASQSGGAGAGGREKREEREKINTLQLSSNHQPLTSTVNMCTYTSKSHKSSPSLVSKQWLIR